MDVRELDIDLIDRINPFGEAYAILAKTMSEDSLKQVAAAIAAKRASSDAGGGAGACRSAPCSSRRNAAGCPRSLRPDAWEKRMAEGVAFLARMKEEAARE